MGDVPGRSCMIGSALSACRRLTGTIWRRGANDIGRFRPAEPWFGGRRGAFGLGAAFLVGVLSLATWVLSNAHHEAEAQAQRTVKNLAQVLEKDIARNLELYNLAFDDVIAALQIPGLSEASPDLRRAALFSHVSQARYMSSLLVIDEHGDLIAESNNVEHRRVNFADREYFQVHRDRTDAGLYFSRPLLSRFDGLPNMAISRRLAHADGSFAGVVATGIRLEFFQNLFTALDLGSQGNIALFRDDGPLLARWPADPRQIGQDLQGAAIFQALRSAPSGVFSTASKIDGVERFYGYRRVAEYPLVIDVGLSRAEVFAPWRMAAWLTASMAGTGRLDCTTRHWNASRTATPPGCRGACPAIRTRGCRCSRTCERDRGAACGDCEATRRLVRQLSRRAFRGAPPDNRGLCL